MKISLLKYYKTSIISLSALGIFAIVLSFIFTFFDGSNLDDYIMLFVTVPVGIAVSLFPILINYKQLTCVVLSHEKCISYSLLRKKLCQINFDEHVFYSFFDVRFSYKPVVRFIALSNMPFNCEQNNNISFKRSFMEHIIKNKL